MAPRQTNKAAENGSAAGADPNGVDPNDAEAVKREAERLEAEEAAKAKDNAAAAPPAIKPVDPAPTGTVRLNFRRAFTVALDNDTEIDGVLRKKGSKLYFRAGVNNVPEALKDHWFVKNVTIPEKPSRRRR